MLRLSFLKCHGVLESILSSGPIDKVFLGRQSLNTLFRSFSVSTGSKGTLPLLSSLTTSSGTQGALSRYQEPSLNHQQVRHGHKYYVKDGSIKWLRRRAKALEQRKKVLNPSTPVIEQRTPLPMTNVGRIPEDLFGYKDDRGPVADHVDKLEITKEINRQLGTKEHGRLFAVINLKGKQFKVTSEDIIILQGYWEPDVGDRIRLHKILLLGGSDFTLIGRPLIDDEMVRIEGTVIEKTLSYTKLHFRLKKRKNFRRLKFSKEPYTMLRINMIELLKPLSILESREDETQTIDATVRVATNP